MQPVNEEVSEWEDVSSIRVDYPFEPLKTGQCDSEELSSHKSDSPESLIP